MLRLSFVTGTEPGKWFDRYRAHCDSDLVTIPSDDPMELLLDVEKPDHVDLVLTRLPDARIGRRIRGLHVVELYKETVGVAVPKDHTLTLAEEVIFPDIVDEKVLYCWDGKKLPDVAAIREHLRVVAANVGIVIAPRPILKVLSKKEVVPVALDEVLQRPEPVDPDHFIDRYEGETLKFPITQSTIALVWRKKDDCDAIQDFVGIAKGRTPRSTRSSGAKREQKSTANKKPNNKQTPKKAAKAPGRRRSRGTRGQGKR